MQSKPKSNSVITHAVDEATGAITFRVAGAGEFTFDPSTCSDAVERRATIHGYIQRISDAAAMSRNPANGQRVDPTMRLAAMRRIADHYASGAETWAIPRAEGAAVGLSSIILAAVAEVRGCGIDEVRGLVTAGAAKRGLTERAFLAALGEADLVRPVVARIRGERAPGVDANSLLEGLDEDDVGAGE